MPALQLLIRRENPLLKVRVPPVGEKDSCLRKVLKVGNGRG